MFMYKKLSAMACALTLALGAAAPAQAAIFVGSFDPAFGGGFTNLNWEGEVRLFVSEACLAQGNDVYSTETEPCDTSSIISSSLTLYNRLPATGATLAFERFATVYDVAVQNNTLKGFRTGLGFSPTLTSEMLQAPIDGVAAGHEAFGYRLEFDFDADNGTYARLFAIIDVDTVTETPSAWNLLFESSGALRSNCRLVPPESGVRYYECESENTPSVAFRLEGAPTDVPEPGSLALVAAALLGAGWAGHRRRAIPR